MDIYSYSVDYSSSARKTIYIKVHPSYDYIIKYNHIIIFM